MKLILTTNNGLIIDQAKVTKAEFEEAVVDKQAALRLLQHFAEVQD